MAVRDFMLINRSDRRVLADRLSATFDRWCTEWCVDDTARVSVVLCEDDDLAPLARWSWRTGSLPGGFSVAAGLAPGSLEPLMSCLLGDRGQFSPARTEPACIERELEQSAIEALVTLLVRDSQPGTAPMDWHSPAPAADVLQRREGFVAARCTVGAVEILVVLEPGVTKSLLAAARRKTRADRPPPMPVQRIVSSRKVVVQACVGSAELAVRELAGLAVGDVIALDRRLEEPVVVKLADASDLCAGYLGAAEGRKAVQLIDANTKQEA